MKQFLKHLLWKTVTRDPQYDEVQVNCPEITIPGVSPDLYAKLLSQATAAGATFSGDVAEWHGCQLSWSYDAPSQTLSATCTKKPFYISCVQIEAGLLSEVEKAKNSI